MENFQACLRSRLFVLKYLKNRKRKGRKEIEGEKRKTRFTLPLLFSQIRCDTVKRPPERVMRLCDAKRCNSEAHILKETPVYL